jgi:hypothetical protein
VNSRPLNGGFSIVMHIIQLCVIVAGAVWIFSELKGDVRLIDQKVTNVQEDVTHIKDYLGIWQPKAAR